MTANKGFQSTTHNVSVMHTASLATHLYGMVRGSRLNPDVGGIRKGIHHGEATKRDDIKIATNDIQLGRLP